MNKEHFAFENYKDEKIYFTKISDQMQSSVVNIVIQEVDQKIEVDKKEQRIQTRDFINK